MNHKKTIAAMSALSQPVRLAAMFTLTRAGTDGMSVNDLAAATGGVLHNSMSVHLAILSRAGLVKGAKVGRETIYRANRGAIAELAVFIGQLAKGEAGYKAE